MRRKDRIPSMFFVACMTAVLLSGAALVQAETADVYGLWIGGVQVTAENMDDITAAVNAKTPDAASGDAVFDPQTNTLTLDNFIYAGEGYAFNGDQSRLAAAVYSSLDTLNIIAYNWNQLHHEADCLESYGIYATGGLEITGKSTGVLNVGCDTAEERSVGIFVSNKSLVVNGGTLIGVGGDAGTESGDLSTGVWCLNGDITVNRQGTLVGEGGSSYISRGICAFGKLTVFGGTAEGTGGSGGMISHGISAGTLESSSESGRITGMAGSAGESMGVVIWDESALSKGKLKGISAAGEDKQSYGIYAYDGLTLHGGITEAQGADGAFNQAPVIAPGFKGAGMWYGETKEEAEASGAKPKGDLAAKYMQKYVRIEFVHGFDNGPQGENLPVDVPDTGDKAKPVLWIGLMMIGLAGLCASSVSQRRRKRLRE